MLTVVDLIRTVLSPELERLGLSDGAAIANYLDKAGYPERLPFGKHKGRHWKEAVTDADMLGWLQWLARQKEARSAKMGNWYLQQVALHRPDD